MEGDVGLRVGEVVSFADWGGGDMQHLQSPCAVDVHRELIVLCKRDIC